MAQTVAALDFVCNDPHLKWKKKTKNQDEKNVLLMHTVKKNKPTNPKLGIDVMVLTWSRGPTETLRTLFEMCSQEEP